MEMSFPTPKPQPPSTPIEPTLPGEPTPPQEPEITDPSPEWTEEEFGVWVAQMDAVYAAYDAAWEEFDAAILAYGESLDGYAAAYDKYLRESEFFEENMRSYEESLSWWEESYAQWLIDNPEPVEEVNPVQAQQTKDPEDEPDTQPEEIEDKYSAAKAAAIAAEEALLLSKANPKDPVAVARQVAAIAARNEAASMIKVDPEAAAAAAVAIKASISTAVVAGASGQKIDATVFSALAAATGSDFVESLAEVDFGVFVAALEQEQIDTLLGVYAEDPDFREFVGLPPLNPVALVAKNNALLAVANAAQNPVFASSAAATANAEAARIALKSNPNDPEALAAKQAAMLARESAAVALKADPVATAAAAVAKKAAADAAIAAASVGEKLNDAVFATLITAVDGEDFVSNLAGTTAAQFALALDEDQIEALIDLYIDEPEFRDFAGLPPLVGVPEQAVQTA